MAKMKRQPSTTVRYRYNIVMYLVHMDTMGPIALPSSHEFGNCYIIEFIDNASRYAWAYPMTDKTQIHLAFEKMLENVRTIRGRVGDNRTEYTTEYMTEKMKRIFAEGKY